MSDLASSIGMELSAPREGEAGSVVTLRAPAGLCGPPGVLQGGLSAGLALLAVGRVTGEDVVSGSLRARLHLPTPLEEELEVVVSPGAAGREHEVRTMVAGQPAMTATVSSGRPHGDLDDRGLVELATVPLPTPEDQTMTPTCWGCGDGPMQPDGLRLVPAWHGPDAVCVRLAPTSTHTRPDGALDPLTVAAALDCPTLWAAIGHVRARGDATGLLGGYHLDLHRPVPADRALRVVARADAPDGRKLRTRGALVDEEGTVFAVSNALHVSVPRMPGT